METQNTEVALHFLEVSAQNPLQLGTASVERLSPEAVAGTATAIRPKTLEVATVIRPALSDDRAPDFIAGSGIKPNRTTPQSAAKRRQVCDHPPLAKNPENLAQRMRARRFRAKAFPHQPVAWLVATLAIIGVLAAMLMVGIAISV
jgi:hypothetical protein